MTISLMCINTTNYCTGAVMLFGPIFRPACQPHQASAEFPLEPSEPLGHERIQSWQLE
jgi:hypothetical protein